MDTSIVHKLTTRVKRVLRKHWAIIAVLLFQAGLLTFLANTIFTFDATDWFENAYRFYTTGEMGFQFRNILFSYLLTIPLYLKISPAIFILFLSGISYMSSGVLLYKINIRFCSREVAALTSLIFALSFIFIRHATQIWSDIITMFFVMLALYACLKVLWDKKRGYLPGIYFFASCAISMRYSTVFIMPALLFVLFRYRKEWKVHLLGIALACIPYIPQYLFNLTHLDSPLSLSYSATQPTVALQYFVHEKVKGYDFQFLHYLKYLFFHFKGIFVWFLPFVLWGLFHRGTKLSKESHLFLILFTFGFLFGLSFFVSFDTRYAIPALLPCFIWMCIGIQRAFRFAKQSRMQVLLSLYLFVGTYIVFELDFHVLQSIRAIHHTRLNAFTTLNGIIDDYSVVMSETVDGKLYYNPLIKSIAYEKDPVYRKVHNTKWFDPDRCYLARRFFYIVPVERWNVDGGTWSFPFLKESGYTFKELRRIQSGEVRELTFYPLLRHFNKRHLIPQETWVIYEVTDFGDGVQRGNR